MIVHGADSRQGVPLRLRARACRAAGLAAVAFDLRGHGDERRPARRPRRRRRRDGRRGPAARARALRARLEPRRLAGASSPGARLGAAGVVAICPASGDGLRRALRAGRFDFPADVGALEARAGRATTSVAAAAALGAAAACSSTPRATRSCPVDARRARCTTRRRGSRFVEVPGGHHRSVQHDAELQAAARALPAAGRDRRRRA